MLENCSTLNECERVIYDRLRGIDFLGEIELTLEDAEKLRNLISDKLSDDLSLGMDQIEKFAPACFSLYLVLTGIYYYKNGSFWPYVLNGNIDVNTRVRMGQIFLNFIYKNNLKSIILDDSLQYVTPILLHGGIPQNCLNEFFDKVILPITKNAITDEEGIKDYLFTLRFHENQRIKLKREIAKTLKKISYLRRMKQNSELYKNYYKLVNKKKNLEQRIQELIAKRNEYQDRCSLLKTDIPINIHKSVINKCKEHFDYIQNISNRLYVLSLELDNCKQLINELYNTVLNSEWDIVVLNKIEKLNLENSRLIVNQINTCIEQNNVKPFIIKRNTILRISIIISITIIILLLIKIPINNKVSFILSYLLLFFIYMLIFRTWFDKKMENLENRKKKEIDNLQKTLYELFSGIPLKDGICFNINTIDVFDKIKSMYGEFCKVQKEYIELNSILTEHMIALKEAAVSIVENINTDYTENIGQFIEHLDLTLSLREKIENEMNPELENLYGIDKYIVSKLNVLKKMINGQHFELQDESSVDIEITPENEITLDQIDEKINNLFLEKQEKENQLASFTQKIGIIDEPILRFVLFGDKWAEKIIIRTVEYLNDCENKTLKDKQYYELPERIINGFSKWWSEKHKKSFTKEVEKEQKITMPYFKYDNALGVVKLIVDSQVLNLNYMENSRIKINVIYNDYVDNNQTLFLKFYKWEQGLIKTEPCELIINNLFGGITVSLSIDDIELQRWNYDLISTDSPFIAFNENGVKIKDNKLVGKTVWLILWEKFKIDENICILEENISGGYQDTIICLVDLFGENQLELINKSDGSKFISDIINNRFFVPYFEGGEIVKGITFNGQKVYSTKPDFLIIPFDQDNLGYWSYTVRYTNNNDSRKHYIINQLNSLIIDEEKGRAKILLSFDDIFNTYEGNIVFTIYYRRKKQFIFELNIIQHLYVIVTPNNIRMPLPYGELLDFKVVIPTNSTLELNSPSRIEYISNNECLVTAKPETGLINGVFRMPINGSFLFETQISIEIPVFQWKITGLPEFETWNCCVKEIWVEDLNINDKLSLELYAPYSDFRYAKIFIANSTYHKDLEISNGRVSFDLRNLYDSLRTDKKAKNICVNLYSSNKQMLISGIIFYVQCKWEIISFKYSVNDYEYIRSLYFTWYERGKAENKLIKIWKRWAPDSEPLTFKINDCEYEFTVENNKCDMPNGEYLLSFETEDPWSGYSDNLVSINNENTFKITIYDDAPYIKDWKIHWMHKNKAKISGNIVNAKAQYELAITLFGFYRGKEKSFTSTKLTDLDGNFELNIVNRESNLNMREVVHWIGFIFQEQNPVYDFYILPNPAYIEWNIDDLNTEYINNAIDYKIKITEMNYGNETILPNTISDKLISSILNKKMIEIPINYAGTSARIKYDPISNKLYMQVNKGVKCVSCGKIFPDQQSWHSHSRRCNRMILNFSEARVRFYLLWNINNSNTNSIYNNLLFSSKCYPITNKDEFDFNNINEIVCHLLEREKEIYKMRTGGLKNGN